MQDALLEGQLSSLSSWGALAKVAARCGIVTVGVEGTYGRIVSSVHDAEILREYARSRTWARRTNDLLRSFFDGRGGHYVDVGANIGLTTIHVAQNALVQCLALEPDPTNYAHLVTNVATNCRSGNVEARQVAVFSKRSILSLELAPNNPGDHRLRLTNDVGQLGEEAWSTISVEAVPLDELVSDRTRPLAIKIDTQGAEPFVYAGGFETLAAADLVITEWAPYWLARLGGNPTVITDFLCANFHEISIAEGEEGEPVTPRRPADAADTLLEMARRDRGDPRRYADIIARK